MKEKILFNDWMEQENFTGYSLAVALTNAFGIKTSKQVVYHWAHKSKPKKQNHIDALEKVSGKKLQEFRFKKDIKEQKG